MRNFLKELKNEQQIEQQKNNVTLIISILNYDEYQNKNSKTNSRRTAEEQQKDTNNNNNKENHSNNINIEVFNFWNQMKIINHKKIDDFIKPITEALKKHPIEEIKKAIERYSIDLNSESYFKHKWKLDKFLKQKNAMPDYFDDGVKWINYQNFIKKQNAKPSTNGQAIKYEPKILDDIEA